MIEETQKYFFILIENIINKTMHDIISPITAIMNSASILSSREGNKVESKSYSFPSSRLFQMIDDAIEQIINQINTAKYLYSIGREKFSIPNTQFINDWEKILYNNKIKINLKNQDLSINCYSVQFISHIIFLFKYNLKTETNINITVNKYSFDIQLETKNQRDFDNQFKKITDSNQEEINPINTNLYFLKSIIDMHKVTFKQIKNKITVHLHELSDQYE